MKKNRLFALLSITVIFVFVTSLFSTVNVLADDSTPPAPTEEPVQPPSEGSTVEETPTEVPIEADPTFLPEVDPTPELDTPAEVLESAPQGVDVVVLDENGEAMPLATEEAAQIIMSGDPIWCPDDLDGTPQDNPTAGMNGCTVSEMTFVALLGHLNTGAYTGNGTIFVSYDYSASESLIEIDHTVSGLTGLGDLTIQGGWEFGVGMYNNDSSSQSTLSGTWLVINNWVGNVTINNLFITNSDEDGLYINTQGDVALNDLEITNSDLAGAHIEAGGDVTVTNSDFTTNGLEGDYSFDSDIDYETETYTASSGLWVNTQGDVTLNNVYAANNSGDGATIFGADIEITDSGFENNGWGELDGYGANWNYYFDFDNATFNANASGGNGLDVTSTGNITINNICVCRNAGTGAVLDADGNISISDSGFNENGYFGTFSISDEYSFNGADLSADFLLTYSAGDGLNANAAGTLTLHDVTAGDNANNGADVLAAGNVLIDDESVFINNGWSSGIFDGSSCDGYYCGYDFLYDFLVDNEGDTAFCETIDNAGFSYEALVFNPCDYYDFIEVQGSEFKMRAHFYTEDSGAAGSNGYSISQNGGSGLEAESENGSLTLNEVGVYDNAGEGAVLNGNAQVTVTDSEFIGNGLAGWLEVGESLFGSPSEMGAGGHVEFFYGSGLTIYTSAGNVTLSQVAADGNAFHGAQVNAGGSVFVEDGEFISNGYFVNIGGDGCGCEGGLFSDFLDYYDDGTLNDSFPGMELPASGFDLAVNLYDSDQEGSFYIDLDFGSGSGLFSVAGGDNTLVDVYAEDNLGFGALLFSGSNLNVTDSEFYLNGYGISGIMGLEITDDYFEAGIDIANGSGLYGFANNDVTLNGVIAEDNALHGAELYSNAVNSVFVEDSEFNGNGYGGFWLHGLHYEDEEGSRDESLERYGSGLYIESGGNVTLVDVDANGNYQDGAEVDSQGGRVIVSCGQYDDNGEYGIYEDGASSLELYGPEIEGNGNSPDEYFFSGSLILSDDCTIPVDPAKPTIEKTKKVNDVVVAVCDGRETAAFVLPNGDFVAFPCPINDQAFVQTVFENDLPEKLDEGLKFLSALKTNLIRDNAVVEELEKPVVVSFLLPEGVDTETLSIVFWNGEEWIDLGGEVSDDGLYFEVSTKVVGTFVLVSK